MEIKGIITTIPGQVGTTVITATTAITVAITLVFLFLLVLLKRMISLLDLWAMGTLEICACTQTSLHLHLRVNQQWLIYMT